jgi:stage II sporulation protein D
MSADEISEIINKNIPARHAANPTLIHFLNDSETIGELQYMEVMRRGQGGNIMEMIFYGTKNSVRVQTEFNIRALLNPGDIPVTRNDGSFSNNLTLLPSAFFTYELSYGEGKLQSVTIFGGGNGHGVGMSQNGVRALLDMGLSYTEILRHYYPGTEVLSVAE